MGQTKLTLLKDWMPDLGNASHTDWRDQNGTYVRWPAEPADDGSELVQVWVSLDWLGKRYGGALGNNHRKICAALTQELHQIERLAREKYRRGDASVTIDAGN